MRLVCGDALEELAKLPDRSVDLVLADPPYNVGVQTTKNGRKTTCQWDKIDGYADWFLGWVKECQRVLKPNGVFYFFHNDMAQIAELMERIKWETEFAFVSFCIWDKGETYRSRSWRDRDPEGKTALRCWFNRCEYCLHYFLAPKTADASWGKTGLERINSNPNCYRPIKEQNLEGTGDTRRCGRNTRRCGRNTRRCGRNTRKCEITIGAIKTIATCGECPRSHQPEGTTLVKNHWRSWKGSFGFPAALGARYWTPLWGAGAQEWRVSIQDGNLSVSSGTGILTARRRSGWNGRNPRCGGRCSPWTTGRIGGRSPSG